MKTLDEIKEEVARDKGFKDWNALFTATGTTYLEYRMNEVAKRYAIAYDQALLQKASEEVQMIHKSDNGDYEAKYDVFGLEDSTIIIDKYSILNTKLDLI